MTSIFCNSVQTINSSKEKQEKIIFWCLLLKKKYFFFLKKEGLCFGSCSTKLISRKNKGNDSAKFCFSTVMLLMSCFPVNVASGIKFLGRKQRGCSLSSWEGSCKWIRESTKDLLRLWYTGKVSLMLSFLIISHFGLKWQSSGAKDSTEMDSNFQNFSESIRVHALLRWWESVVYVE